MDLTNQLCQYNYLITHNYARRKKNDALDLYRKINLHWCIVDVIAILPRALSYKYHIMENYWLLLGHKTYEIQYDTNIEFATANWSGSPLFEVL